MPLNTAPSCSNRTPCSAASAWSSAPASATGPLFVVVTCLPDSMAHRTCEMAGSPSTGLVNVASTTVSAVVFRMTYSLRGCASPPMKPANVAPRREREHFVQVDALCLHEGSEPEVGDGDHAELEAEFGGQLGAAVNDELGERAVDAAEADQCQVVSVHVGTSLVEAVMVISMRADDVSRACRSARRSARIARIAAIATAVYDRTRVTTSRTCGGRVIAVTSSQPRRVHYRHTSVPIMHDYSMPRPHTNTENLR